MSSLFFWNFISAALFVQENTVKLFQQLFISNLKSFKLLISSSRSKFDAVDILSSGSSTTSSDDLLEIALQKSRDPSEQIDEENRVMSLLMINILFF